jgi:hypothetical protein
MLEFVALGLLKILSLTRNLPLEEQIKIFEKYDITPKTVNHLFLAKQLPEHSTGCCWDPNRKEEEEEKEEEREEKEEGEPDSTPCMCHGFCHLYK